MHISSFVPVQTTSAFDFISIDAFDAATTFVADQPLAEADEASITDVAVLIIATAFKFTFSSLCKTPKAAFIQLAIEENLPP